MNAQLAEIAGFSPYRRCPINNVSGDISIAASNAMQQSVSFPAVKSVSGLKHFVSLELIVTIYVLTVRTPRL